MSNYQAGVVAMDAVEDGKRVLAIALKNMQGGVNGFLQQGMPNRGDTCRENEESYAKALPITEEILGLALAGIQQNEEWRKAEGGQVARGA